MSGAILPPLHTFMVLAGTYLSLLRYALPYIMYTVGAEGKHIMSNVITFKHFVIKTLTMEIMCIYLHLHS
jgi:hypothetical protein